MFLKKVSYAYQGCIYLVKNTVKLYYYERVLHNFDLYLKMKFIPAMVKLNFKQSL